jgi:hypothetical protein
MPEISREQLSMLQNALKRALALIDTLVAEPTGDTATENYRQRPFGPLNERGQAEIDRRFEAGLTDSEIALGMDISLTGVSKRRGLWRRGKAK